MSLHSTTDVFVVGEAHWPRCGDRCPPKGIDVVLADGAAPPIEKPCGEGMMPETIAALRDLGVGGSARLTA